MKSAAQEYIDSVYGKTVDLLLEHGVGSLIAAEPESKETAPTKQYLRSRGDAVWRMLNKKETG